MTTKRVTVQQVMDWKPCGYDGPDNGKNYTEARVKRLFGRRKYMAALQLLALDIPYEDRLWGALHEELIHLRTICLFACDVTERALKRERKAGREPDPRSWEAVRVSRLYTDGKATAEELGAAGAAAGAAWEAAWEAERAAWAAREVAAAAWAAAGAARAAAGAAWVAGAAAGVAWEAERAAERKWQVGHLRKMLKREGV